MFLEALYSDLGGEILHPPNLEGVGLQGTAGPSIHPLPNPYLPQGPCHIKNTTVILIHYGAGNKIWR